MATEEKTLLIVDDEATIHRALQRTLRREPYRCLHAYDAAEAWAILERHPEVDAIVCDHYMPGTPGLELLMDVRSRLPGVATILLTAQADLQLVMSAINEGRIHRFFTKPWDATELRAGLRALVGEGDPSRELDQRESDRRAQKLRDELLPMRDEETGAFILEDPGAAS